MLKLLETRGQYSIYENAKGDYLFGPCDEEGPIIVNGTLEEIYRVIDILNKSIHKIASVPR